MQSDSRPVEAVVFPGMGPFAFADVARFLLIDRKARALVARADAVLGYSLIDRYRESEGDYSEDAQLAFLVSSLALAGWAEEHLEMAPAFAAGPSFGAMAAAVHAGALGFADGVRMVSRRARCLEEYFAAHHTDLVTQSFARLPREALDEILGELTERGEWYEVSCRVDHDLAMLTVREGLLDELDRRIRSLGGLALYAMRPPLHCGIFGPLRELAEERVFAGLEFSDPAVPLVADQDGARVRDAAGVRRMLLDGYDRPVHWPRVVDTLRAAGVRRAYVTGPDRLFGRVRRTTDAFEVVPVDGRRALRPRARSAAARTGAPAR
ncbi:ACP S-malonyltransferase [Streptomyces sp. enrichment culture]|uniref:ACP S-malonyltransferase n=1 Tax=Streptomyces sp. enrichment culture TaxID=1795815 RepID=UPI003F5451EF